MVRRVKDLVFAASTGAIYSRGHPSKKLTYARLEAARLLKHYSSSSASAAAVRDDGRGLRGAVTYAYGSSGLSGSDRRRNNLFNAATIR